MENLEKSEVTTNSFWAGTFFHLFFLTIFLVLHLVYFPSKSSDGPAAIIAGMLFIGIAAIVLNYPIGILVLRVAKYLKHNGLMKYFLGLVVSVSAGAFICGLAAFILSPEPRFFYQLTLISSVSGSVAGCLTYISCM
jgi:hypothetical protein